MYTEYIHIGKPGMYTSAKRRDRSVNANDRRPSSSADNNYFRHFLAFHAASPSIRKSYKPTVTFTPKFKTGKGRGENGRRGGERGGGPRPRVSPCLVKYHLIPREIRFNFTRHNTPAASFVLSVSSVHVRQWSKLHLQRLIVEKGNGRFVDHLTIRYTRWDDCQGIDDYEYFDLTSGNYLDVGKNLDVGN